MRRVFIAIAALTGPAVVAVAQAPATWELRAMVGPHDSVIVTFTITVGADGKWTMALPEHDPIPMRFVTTGGDSTVAEAGPYASVLRKGETVNARYVAHFRGDEVSGTFAAQYSGGTATTGKIAGTKRP